MTQCELCGTNKPENPIIEKVLYNFIFILLLLLFIYFI